MEDKHRKLIEENIDKLMDNTDYSKLIHACVKHDILSIRMYQNIEHDKLLNGIAKDMVREKHKRLFMKITKRGPDAYQKLINILNSLGFYEAADILLDVKFTSINDTMKKVNNNVKVIEKFNVIKSKSLKKSEKYYPMVTKNRGILFVVDNTALRHSKTDKDTLIDTFEQFNFKIYWYENMNKSEFIRKLKGVLASDETKMAESFVLAVISNGKLIQKELQFIEFEHQGKMKTSDIQEQFSAKNCPYLSEKPKMFIYSFWGQEERKTDTDSIRFPAEENRVEKESERSMKICLADTLVCYGNELYTEAEKDVGACSWFIKELCKQLSQHAHDTDMENILKEVQEAYKENINRKSHSETSYQNIGLSKTFYLNPGIFEDEYGQICSFEDSKS